MLPAANGDVLVQNFFALPSVAVLVSAPNGGKTALAVHFALHVAARAERWFGMKMRGGPVLYVASEAPGSVVMRLNAGAQQLFPNTELPLYIISDTPKLGDPQKWRVDAARICKSAEQIQSPEFASDAVRLIVVDTLASCLAGGDENGAGMMALSDALKHIAADTGACVLALHHPSKADSKSMRGHGSGFGAIDTQLTIETDGVTGVRTVTLTKARDFAAGREFRFELDVVTLDAADAFGDPRTTVVVRPTDAAPAVKPRVAGKNQQAAIVALREWARTSPEAVMISSIDVVELLKTQNIGRQRRHEVLKSLVDIQVLTSSIGGYTFDRSML